ncbi:MAG: hypothetical protein U0Q22_07795 [Acidimicrobiales bacterium]
MTETPDPAPGNESTPSNAARTLAALGGPALIAVTVVVAFVAGRRLWFFSDDWNIVAGYHSGHLLEPFNSHLSLVPVAAYQVLFHAFGLGSYVPYRVVGLVAYAVLGWVVFRFARERVGPAGAVAATALVLWNSGGVTNVMFPFLMNFSLPIAAVAAAWWHLDRSTTRDDGWASWWLIVALATSGLGLLTAVAVGVELVWTRAPLRRWAILSPGPVLWAAWYVAYGVDSPPSGGIRPVLSYAVHMLWAGVGSLTGGNRWVGLALIAAIAVVIVLSVVRRTFDGRLAGALAAPVAFALLTAVSRIGVVPAIPPDELRYRWTIGAFVVFALVLLVPVSLPRAGVLWRLIVGAAAIAAVVDAVVLVGDVRDWTRTVEAAVPGVRDNLFVAERSAAVDALDRSRALPVSYVKVTAGEYVDAVADLGSPLAGLTERDYGGSEGSRLAADQAVVADRGAHLFMSLGAPDDPRCEAAVSVGAGGSVDVPDGRVLRVTAASDAPVEVRLAVFSTEGASVGTVEAGGDEGTLTVAERTRIPAWLRYRLVVSAPAVVRACDG